MRINDKDGGGVKKSWNLYDLFLDGPYVLLFLNLLNVFSNYSESLLRTS